MESTTRGYWFMTWLGLLANVVAIPLTGVIAFSGSAMRTANISLAISIVWPAAIVGIVACAGLLAERKWGVIVAIVALSMALSVSLPYGIVRFILVRNSFEISSLSILLAALNLFSLLYWCRPVHRRNRRL